MATDKRDDYDIRDDNDDDEDGPFANLRICAPRFDRSAGRRTTFRALLSPTFWLEGSIAP